MVGIPSAPRTKDGVTVDYVGPTLESLLVLPDDCSALFFSFPFLFPLCFLFALGRHGSATGVCVGLQLGIVDC